MAERHYRHAIEVDPRYALAYFDLGNVLDETGRVAEAIQTYGTALQLAPTYADAHYNLALAYEKDQRAPEGLETLARLREAGHGGPLVSSRPQPDPAHPTIRRIEADPGRQAGLTLPP